MEAIRSSSLGRSDADPFVDPVRSVRTFEAAIENIVSGIERARLRSGDRLPNESELSTQLGISKPTLRQALRVLERSGLLVVKQGKTGGVFLSSDFMPAHEISSNIATEERTVLETLRARRVVERAITEEACVAAGDEDLEEIQRTVDLLLGPRLTSTKILHADMMFHRAVARAAHNRPLEEAIRVVYRELAPIRDVAIYREKKQEATRIHEIHSCQLAAMRNRDLDELRRALEVHFRYLEERLAASLGRSWDSLFSRSR